MEKLSVVKNEEPIKYANLPQNTRDFISTDWDRPDLTAEHLVKIGYTPEQATSWLRKMRIRELFEKNERVDGQ